MNGNEINDVALILDEARYLIESEGWCQGAMAKDRLGFPTEPRADNVAARCAVGALDAAVDWSAESEAHYELARSYVDQTIRGKYIVTWNDAAGRTKEEVVAMFTEAADLAREDAKAAGYRPAG